MFSRYTASTNAKLTNPCDSFTATMNKPLMKKNGCHMWVLFKQILCKGTQKTHSPVGLTRPIKPMESTKVNGYS